MAVVPFDKPIPKRTGTAKCTHCGLQFTATVDEDMAHFQCPRCQLNRAVWYGLHIMSAEYRDQTMTCKCGNTFFEITPQAVLCIDCGEIYCWDHVNP